MNEGPFQIYLRLRRDGTLRPDKAQERAVERLQALYEDLKCEKIFQGLRILFYRD